MMTTTVTTPDQLPAIELPVVGAEPPERADAARNRRRILAAAEKLFAENGVSCTSMDAIAAEAGVGKGTLFRRFGDRASLARALLSERDCGFQDAFIRGEPPLGPGAPPAERLVAFGEGMLDLLESHGDLLLAAEGGDLKRPAALGRLGGVLPARPQPRGRGGARPRRGRVRRGCCSPRSRRGRSSTSAAGARWSSSG